MGHTVWSQRVTLDVLLAELEQYGKALRQEDIDLLHRLLKAPLKHVGAMSYANSMHAWAFLLRAVQLEQEKRLLSLEKKYERLVDGCVQEWEQDSALDQVR